MVTPLRTVKFLGQGFCDQGPAEIRVWNDDQLIYQGAVSSLPVVWNEHWECETTDLIVFQIPKVAKYNSKLKIETVKGSVYLTKIFTNFNLAYDFHFLANDLYKSGDNVIDYSIQNSVFDESDWQILNDIDSTFEQCLEIYKNRADPPLTERELAILSTTDPERYDLRQQILKIHNIDPYMENLVNVFTETKPGYDPRSNVHINDEYQDLSEWRNKGMMGTWHWHIPKNSVFLCDFTIITSI